MVVSSNSWTTGCNFTQCLILTKRLMCNQCINWLNKKIKDFHLGFWVYAQLDTQQSEGLTIVKIQPYSCENSSQVQCCCFMSITCSVFHFKVFEDTMLWFATVQRWYIPNFNWGWISWLHVWGIASWELYSLLYLGYNYLFITLQWINSVCSCGDHLKCRNWPASVVTGRLALCFLSSYLFGQKLMALDTSKTVLKCFIRVNICLTIILRAAD